MSDGIQLQGMDGRDAEDIFMEIRRTEPGQDDFFNIIKRSALLIQETPENTVSRGARVIRVNLKRTKQSAMLIQRRRLGAGTADVDSEG